MVSKVPHHAVTVHREGRNVTPPVGVPFDFTEEEVAHVAAANEHALRDPINENVAMNESDITVRGKKPPEDVSKIRDANVLSRAPAKAGGVARNQGGSLEEENVASGRKSLAQEQDDETL